MMTMISAERRIHMRLLPRLSSLTVGDSVNGFEVEISTRTFHRLDPVLRHSELEFVRKRMHVSATSFFRFRGSNFAQRRFLFQLVGFEHQESVPDNRTAKSTTPAVHAAPRCSHNCKRPALQPPRRIDCCLVWQDGSWRPLPSALFLRTWFQESATLISENSPGNYGGKNRYLDSWKIRLRS